MKMSDRLTNLCGEADPRDRRRLAPTRVMKTFGDVTGEEHLLLPKTAQIALCADPARCVLKSGADAPAAVLLDFGIELHGTVTLSVARVLPQGETATVRIRLGESVSEALTPLGERGTTNDHATRDFTLPVTAWSANESPESGFRFAYIELITPDVTLHLHAVHATLVFRDLPWRGSFVSSDARLNQIYDTAAYTVQLTMQRYLWDGIKRDRLVWAGDMNTEIHTILAVFGGGCDVVPRSLDFIRDVTPPESFMHGFSSYSLWWVLCHYDWYMGTGDLAYLTEQKEYLTKLIPRYFDLIGENGAEKLPEGRFFDWPNQENEAGKHAGLQGLMRLSLRAAGELFRYLGEEALAAQCVCHADRLLAHRPNPAGQKQPAAMLALSGIADPGEMYRTVIAPGGAAGLSSFLGYFTLSAASEAGETAGALDILRAYWGAMLDLGATTFWEDFDISWSAGAHRIDEMPVPGKKDPHGDCGAFCYKNFRHSLCHGWASGPAPFLARYVLGIRPMAPGCRMIRFSPDLGDLAWARGSYPTPQGDITVELSRAADGRTLSKIDAPDGVGVSVK